jgi:aminoglycoside/choline kinase family phosphotransferase
MDERLSLLKQWLSDSLELESFELAMASGDASFRRYFRLTQSGMPSRIVMDAPPPQEDCRPFAEMTARLRETGVHAPEILAMDLEQGFMVLEDFGDATLLPNLTQESADQLYGSAMTSLLTFQQSAKTDNLPAYDEPMLMREMQLFPDWLLEKHLDLKLSDDSKKMLARTFNALTEAALEQPKVFVHRDYHSRNLMLLSDNRLGVIDYQDAVLGPVTYDLVSLLRDCYIAWDDALVSRWCHAYLEGAIATGVMNETHRLRFKRWFDWMGVQRHLKASGIFARLNHRDGKPGYLRDIPRTLNYIVNVGKQYEELMPLSEFVSRRVLPAL